LLDSLIVRIVDANVRPEKKFTRQNRVFFSKLISFFGFY